MQPRHPSDEAARALDDDALTPLVLEPSPPASDIPPYFADDPTDPDGVPGPTVGPTSDATTTWTDLVGTRPALGAFTGPRWLDRSRRLGPLTEAHTTTRQALHQVAYFALAPKRYRANGKIGLRWTLGGFGTPFFGSDEQVRVEGDTLVHQSEGAVRSIQLTTVGAACQFLEIPYEVRWFPDFQDPLAPLDPDDALAVDVAAAHAIGDWFGFATSVLEELRRTDGAEAVGRVQLWPEHFDPAVEIGDADAGRRASFGASPGDDGHADPYLYVAPWAELETDDPFWNADTFDGALLPYRRLLDTSDQHADALAFLRAGWDRLSSS